MNTTPSMTFTEAMANVFNTTKDYSNYSGRARRSEFWYTTLICTVMSLAIDGIGYLVESVWEENGFVSTVFTVAAVYFFIANYSCLCRRMHDIGRNCLLPGLTLSFAIVAFFSLMLSQNAFGKLACIVFSTITLFLLVLFCISAPKTASRARTATATPTNMLTPTTTRSLTTNFGRNTATRCWKTQSDKKEEKTAKKRNIVLWI